MLRRRERTWGTRCWMAVTLISFSTQMRCRSREFQEPLAPLVGEAQTEAFGAQPLENREVVPAVERDYFLNIYGLKERSGISLVAQKLPQNLHAPVGIPVRPYFNTHLLWVIDAQNRKLDGYRPVITTTGCDSGCSPVAFHLNFDASGKVIKILEHAEYPLTKLYHQPFSEDDKVQLLRVAQSLPEALRYVGEPKWLTNRYESFPYQTWTTFQKSVVQGAAYTSYRVFDAALGVAEFVAKDKVRVDLRAQQMRRISEWGNSLDAAPASAKEAIFAKGVTLLNGNDLLPEMQYLLAASLVEVIKDHQAKKLPTTPYIVALGQAQPLGTYYKSFSCEVLKIAFEDEAARRDFLLPLSKDPNPQKRLGNLSCGEVADRLLPVLAQRLEAQPVDVAALKWIPEDLETLRFVVASPLYLAAFADLQRALGRPASAQAAFAELKVRYPLFLDTGLKIKIPAAIEGTPAYTQAKAKVISELSRSVVSEPTNLPAFAAFQADKSIDLSKIGKRILVFFAPWCPHCRATISGWVKNASPDFWKNTALVQIYEKGGQRETQDFCDAVQLALAGEDLCRNIVKVPQTNTNLAAFRAMGIQGVPRVTVLNKQGKIAVTDAQLGSGAFSNSAQDLFWLLQSQGE